MPFYLQGVRGLTASQVGLLIVPSAVAFIITGPVGGRLSDRHGWRPFTAGGLVIAAAGMFVLSRSDESTPIVLLVLAMLVLSLGVGVFGAPNSSSVLSAVGPAKYGLTSGFLNLVRNVGNVTGIALATAIVTAVMASEGLPPSLSAVADGDVEVLGAFTSGATAAYAIAAALVLGAAGLSALSGGRPTRERG
jgi:MFS family permease